MSIEVPSTVRWSARATGWHAAAAIGPSARTIRRRAAGWLVRTGLRTLMRLYGVAVRIAIRIGPPPRHVGAGGRHEVLLTFTCQAESWAGAHLGPLARSSRVGGVTVVTSSRVPAIDGVTVIRPLPWLTRTIGEVPARLLAFGVVALKRRPDLVGGFHLQMNGLASLLIGRLVGARTAYFCVGGPIEMAGGGIGSENRLFAKLHRPDPLIERQLIEAAGAFDLVVTMGTRAVTYLRERGATAACRVIPGGIDRARFAPGDGAPDIDILYVGRLAPIKRVDLLLRAVRCVAGAVPDVRAVLVGDGPLRASLEALAEDLGIAGNVSFAGRQQDVPAWLRRSRIFMLASESEGLALSLMEAMACGVAPVVANVGDLADLVKDGENGYLVAERTPEAFAAPAARLLTDSGHLQAVRTAALAAAERNTTSAAVERWNGAFGAWDRGAR